MDTKIERPEPGPSDHRPDGSEIVSDDEIRRFRAAEKDYLERHPLDRWEARPEEQKKPEGKDGAKDDAEKDEGDKKDPGDGKEGEKGGGDQKTSDGSGKKGMSRGRRTLLIVIAVIVAIALAVAGFFYWQYSRQFETTDDAFVDTHVSQIAARISGQVEAISVDDNQHVEAGQPILEIDKRDYQIKLAQAEAQRDNAVAQLAQAQAQVGLQQANIDQMEANVAVAQAEFIQAQQDYARFKNIDPKAVTQQQIDNANATLKSQTAKLQAAVQSVAGARAQLEASKAQVTAAKAQVENADTGIASAKLQLSYATIQAPITGRITRKTVSVGNYVNPGVPLLAIVPEDMWVTANLKETQLRDMKPGQPVDIRVDAFPQQVFHGKVESIQRGTGQVFSSLPSENATGNYVKVVQRVPVKLVFTDDEYKKFGVAPGMSVQPKIKVR